MKIMKGPDHRPEIKLLGEDSNAFSILARVKVASEEAGADKEYIEEFIAEASSGGYQHLLTTAMKFVDVR
jgi:hypothetical protein